MGDHDKFKTITCQPGIARVALHPGPCALCPVNHSRWPPRKIEDSLYEVNSTTLLKHLSMTRDFVIKRPTLNLTELIPP